MSLIAMNLAVAGGAILGWALAAWIWVRRVPVGSIPHHVSVGLTEFGVSFLCVCAIGVACCRGWDIRSRAHLLAWLAGGYILGVAFAPLAQEMFDSRLARFWRYAICEFPPAWGLAGAIVGSIAMSIREICSERALLKNSAQSGQLPD